MLHWDQLKKLIQDFHKQNEENLYQSQVGDFKDLLQLEGFDPP